MREIKFRAWDKESKKMYSDIDSDKEYWLSLQTGAIYDNGKGNHFKVATVELMQFTGLKDKNEKEIYEGDIIEQKMYDGEKYILDVEWPFDMFYDGEQPVFPQDCKVIGNIFENSELIKE
jgi:hypothetical protein